MANVLVHKNGGTPKIWVLMSDGAVYFGSLCKTGGLQRRPGTKATPAEKIADSYLLVGTFPDSVVMDFVKSSTNPIDPMELRRLCSEIESRVGNTERVNHVRRSMPTLPGGAAAASPATPAPVPAPKKKPSLLKNWMKPSSDEPYAW
ncbi:MAG: hypothetical protein KJZ90_03355 [Rhodocyclaceae bacterium]|nr:hypothetical protein [Rhodocyclaceae bacterium]